MAIYIFHKELIMAIFLLIELILSKKINAPEMKDPKSIELNECQRCKILTDSFEHWMAKTSRGKYEGGDAAWEEAKLKSYARSEVRLVEVQEGLCTEVKKHQDDCYSLAEEAEQFLEKWWFLQDPDPIDLYSWLCIENLQYCCPSQHFGDSCIPCPLDKNNKICSGHGKCDGEGTRKGNGMCVCDKGYDAQFCDECANNYYRLDNICFPCHKSCNGCSGEGRDACTECKKGWELQSGICEDVDECSSPSTCKEHQYCINREGSYSCKTCHISCKTCIGHEPTNCTSCEENYLNWSGMCLDEMQKNDIILNTMQRLAFYLGLSLIALYMLQFSGVLASIVIIIISVYVFYAEKSAQMHLIDVLINAWYS